MKYAYFAASLPSLVFSGPPSMTMERFLGLCRQHLAPADFEALDALLTDRPSEARFVVEWRTRETQLRNAVARARAARLGVEARPWQKDHPGWDVALERAAMDAMGRATPLERELELDRVRWGVAEELARFRPFDLEAILVYALHLRIAERWDRMNADEGRRRLDELVAAAAPARQ